MLPAAQRSGWPPTDRWAHDGQRHMVRGEVHSFVGPIDITKTLGHRRPAMSLPLYRIFKLIMGQLTSVT